MFGGYRKEELPRVIHISIARFKRDLPAPEETLEFLVSIHEEGMGITWQQNIAVDRETEAFFLDATHDLHLWSLNRALTPEKANNLIQELGERLYETFIGSEGHKVLQTITPTAVLLDVDETILNLPWELIATEEGIISQHTPLGRLVTTRIGLQKGRDPLHEDALVKILAVANPTLDLAATEAAVAAIKDLEGNHGDIVIKVTVLSKNDASIRNFSELVATGEFDIVHFAGHAFLGPDAPGSSALRLADGDLTADDVLKVPWKKPPYLVFNSACESGRGVTGQRLVSDESHSNGLAAAFLAAGVYGYAGFFWPVTDVGAGLFVKSFYRCLFERQNVGIAFLEARKYVFRELEEVGDLTSFSGILFGDAASSHRRDLAMAV